MVIAYIVINFVKLPPCLFYEGTHLYCPGCGNTRAVEALVRGDILLSLRQNATILVALVCGIILYTEPIAKAFGFKNYRCPIRNYKFLTVMLILSGIYFIVRNFIPAIAPI